jgi:probable F420-dependent oxidoreductase
MAVTAGPTVPTLSLGVPNFGGWCRDDWRALGDLAGAAETAGVDRLVVNDHVVMGRRTDAYTWGRFPTPPEGPWLEPLTVLSSFAAVTARVRLATGVLIAGLRPAPVLAKTVATLDQLCGGRLDLGVGVGWQREEYDAAGLDFADRGPRLDDTIGACRALWSDLPASYSSPSTSFSDVFCSPQPMQDRLPVWFAGTLNVRNLRRIRELGDGWIPIMGSTLSDVRNGASALATVGRRIEIQAALPVVRRDDRSADIDATMAAVPGWVEAGATDIYVNIAAFAPLVDAAADVVAELVARFRAVTS